MGVLCEAGTAVLCWDLCCVWVSVGISSEGHSSAPWHSLLELYFLYIFFLFFDVAGGWELYHLCELLILFKSFFFAAFISCLFPPVHWSSSAPAPQAKGGTSVAKH